MGLKSFERRKALAALIEGFGVPATVSGPLADSINKNLLEGFFMQTSKPGWKTSEFWLHLLTSVGAIAGTVAGFIPAKFSAVAVAVSGAAYSISRGLAKGNPTAPAVDPATQPPTQ